MALPYNVMAGVVTKATTQTTTLWTLQVLSLGLQILGPESKGILKYINY